MSVFERYARYYDACYRDKDYEGECDFIEAALSRFAPAVDPSRPLPTRRRPARLLELGCGTGNHGLSLASRGYAVSGVDRSSEMLACYRAKAAARALPIELHEQDLRRLDVTKSFDAAICMFDTIGYMPANRDLFAFLTRVRDHVRPDGLFLFEFWHAAAVLRGHEPLRIRDVRTEDGRLLRVSTTTLDIAHQVARVDVRILAFEGDRLVDDFVERHTMRYFLLEEMRFLLEATGWTARHFCPSFDVDGQVRAETWHVISVASPAPTHSGSGQA